MENPPDELPAGCLRSGPALDLADLRSRSRRLVGRTGNAGFQPAIPPGSSSVAAGMNCRQGCLRSGPALDRADLRKSAEPGTRASSPQFRPSRRRLPPDELPAGMPAFRARPQPCRPAKPQPPTRRRNRERGLPARNSARVVVGCRRDELPAGMPAFRARPRSCGPAKVGRTGNAGAARFGFRASARSHP